MAFTVDVLGVIVLAGWPGADVGLLYVYLYMYISVLCMNKACAQNEGSRIMKFPV